jgi:thiol-disulfide isomerase/thioredoxin
MSGLLLFSHVALWGLMIVLYIAVFLLYRHLGSGILDSPETLNNQGPPLKEKPPRLELISLHNERLNLGDVFGRPRVVVFAATGCQSCEKMQPHLYALATGSREKTDTIVVFNGEESEARKFSNGSEAPVAVVADPGFKQTRKWKIRSTPYAVCLDERGSVSQQGHIRSQSGLTELYNIAIPGALTAAQMEQAIADHIEESLSNSREGERMNATYFSQNLSDDEHNQNANPLS